MKNMRLIFVLVAATILGGCLGTKDPVLGPSSDFKLTFKAQYDGQPLVKNTNYDYDTYRVRFTRFNTYLSDITLLKGTEEVRLSDVEWVDFTPSSAVTDAAVEVPVTFNNVPDGDYTGIRIGYGVRPDLNARKPNNFSAGHPLSLENEYWLGWGSYIFTKIEGSVDLNNNDVADGGLIYHCGADATYRTFTFNQPITVGQGAAATVSFDLKKLFETAQNGNWLDLNNPYNQITSNDVNDVVIAELLMNRFGDATKVSQ